LFLIRFFTRRDKKVQKAKKPKYPLKLRIDGDWRLVLRGLNSKLRLTPLMTEIGPTEIRFRADWRWGRVKVGDKLVIELFLSAEEGGPTLTGVMKAVEKDPIDFIYSGVIAFDRPSGEQRRQIDYYLRRLSLRERMGMSTQHLV
jgi:hypothetical protein